MEQAISFLLETYGVTGLIIGFLGWGWFQERKRTNELTDKLFDVTRETTSTLNDLARQIERWAQ